MSPFLSFLVTSSVAHFFSRSLELAEEDDEELGVGVLVLDDVLLEPVDRELLELFEPLDDEPLLLLLPRSSRRRSSLRCSSSRERLLRQSPRLRSPNRLREWSRSESRPPSERELPPDD